MRSGADERVSVTAAVASMLTALTLCPLVSGATWLFVAAIAVVTVMVSGIVARQVLRWWPAVAATQTVVLLITLMVLFARSRIAEGPKVLVDLYTAGMKVTQNQAPPVEATRGIVLLAAGSVALVALLVDILAATLRQPALAGLPLLAVYCVPAALLDGGLPWYYFFAAAAGFLLLLSADAGDRVRGWGRVLTSSVGGAVGRQASDNSLARGGRRVGIATVLVAVALPALVPGLNNQIIGGSGDGDGTGGKGHTITRINPILDLRKNLESRDDTPLLQYQGGVAHPAPLRIVTSDVFDGNTWSPSTTPIPKDNKAQNGLPSPPGLTAPVKTVQATTHIKIGDLTETYLPMPYPAQQVNAKGTWLYDSNTLNVIGDGQTTQGLDYTVKHLDVEPTAEQLADAPPPVSVSSQYLSLPKNLPAVISDTAHEIGQTGTPYQQAVRLQRWFRGGDFVYSVTAPTGKKSDNGTDAIVNFLTQKRGYCVHFASTMAVMARTLGIPARVAVGFLPGEAKADGWTEITSHDAHAWPELFFEGVGWVRFEPTPRSNATAAPAWTVPPAGVLPEDPEPTVEPSQAPTTESSASAAPAVPKKELNDTAVATKKQDGGLEVPWRVLGVAVLIVLALGAPRLTSTLSSRRRWRRARSAGTGPALAEAAWTDLRLNLGDLGIRWDPSWTPRAVVQHLARDHHVSAGALVAVDRLAMEIESARYAPPDGESGRPATERAQDVALVVSEVSELRSSRTTWSARLWPASGVSILAELGPWVNSTADRAGQQASALGTQVKDKVGSGRR